jgi:hypothetical protein
MNTPFHNRLPLEDYAKSRVVVYFYSDRWIPISCFKLTEAIALYRKGMIKGKEIFVFPPGLDLETKNILLSQSPSLQDELASQLACSDTSPSQDLAPLTPSALATVS